MSTTDPLNPRRKRQRQRAAISCTECRRRKQKCNQMKDRPCNNCARRYPPVECEYESDPRSDSKSRERLSTVYVEDSDSQGQGYFEEFERTGSPHNQSMTGLGFPNATPSFLPFRTALTPGYLPSQPLLDYTYSQQQENFRELSPATRERLQTHDGSTADISSIFLVDQPRPGSEAFVHFDAMRYGINFSSDMNMGSQHDDAMRRNAELLHFFINHLLSFQSTIDGFSPSQELHSQWETWMMNSPLVVHVSILAAAYFQATASGVNVEMSVDVMSTRSELIRGINECLTSEEEDGRGVSDEALVAVMGLSFLELVYSDRKSAVAHMSGLRSMINTRGGIDKISNGVLRSLLARTDFQIASTFECAPFLHTPSISPPDRKQTTTKNATPLFPSPTRFSDPPTSEKSGLSTETRALLDDMRFLITSIISLSSSQNVELDTGKIMKTAEWSFARVSSGASPTTTKPSKVKKQEDHLHQTITITAQIFTKAILSRKPLSKSCTLELLKKLWGNMWRVSLTQWKEIPGVFLWVLLVVGPALGNVKFGEDEEKRRMGEFVKGVCAGCLMEFAAGNEDGDIAKEIEQVMSGWLKVQTWLGSIGEDVGSEGEDKGKGKEKEAPNEDEDNDSGSEEMMEDDD